MSLKEFVDRDCGGSNPLMKLTSHFTDDKGQKQYAFGRPPLFIGPSRPLEETDHDQLVSEFLAQTPVNMAPTSFQMDSLLQEIQEIEKVLEKPVGGVEPSVGLPAEDWVNEFEGDVAAKSLGQPNWADEYLAGELSVQTSAVPPTDLWADEFLEFSEKNLSGVQDKSKEPDGKSSAEMSATVSELLQTVSNGDPKLKNSKFVQFLHQIQDGTVKLGERPAGTSELVNADKWVNEFVGEEGAYRLREDNENVWVNEFVKPDYRSEDRDYLSEDASWVEWSRAIKAENQLAKQWSEEFQAEQQSDFWENLQKQWEDLAKQDNTVHDWVTDYDAFDASTYYKDYPFEETNPLLENPDPFNEGLERLKKGEITNAVLLFEAAVKKTPDHAEAWQYLGTTQAANEQDPAAIAALQKCLELEPANLTSLMSLAVSYTNESLQQNACNALWDWLQRNPSYKRLADSVGATPDDNNSSRVMSFMSMDFHEQIKDVYLKAVWSNPQTIDADVQVGLGILFNLSAEYDKAVDCFKAALQLRSDDAMVWNKLGATLANSGQNEEAVDAFRNALAIAPGYVRTRHNLGVACINLGVYREAMEHFLAALNLQKSGRGPKGTSTVMSDNIWSSVRTVLGLMGRTDLTSACDHHDLDILNREFPTDNV